MLTTSWLLLRYCAAPRANYLLRVLPPALSEEYAAAHDTAVARCLAQLLGYADAPLPEEAARAAQLAARLGGLGLRCARADRHAAHWASWCDALPVVRDRAPQVAQRILQALRAPEAEQTPALRAAQHAAIYLRAQGFEVPAWETAAGLAGPLPQAPRGDEPADHLRGWQRRAASACDECALETHLSHLSPASRALLLSQAGPHPSRALNVLPTHEEVVIPSAQFRVLLLQLDPWGDHRAACATGVLPARAILLERALACVCRKAGARVAQNVRLADMNLDASVQDARRIEVVCNGRR